MSKVILGLNEYDRLKKYELMVKNDFVEIKAFDYGYSFIGSHIRSKDTVIKDLNDRIEELNRRLNNEGDIRVKLNAEIVKLNRTRDEAIKAYNNLSKLFIGKNKIILRLLGISIKNETKTT